MCVSCCSPLYERNALGVLAQSHEREAEVRLELLLLEVQPDEWPSYAMREPGAKRRIDERRPDHIARDCQMARTQRDVDRA